MLRAFSKYLFVTEEAPPTDAEVKGAVGGLLGIVIVRKFVGFF
jgi:hypothetical protein